MKVKEAIYNRRSCRAYSGEAIPEEKINAILEAGLIIPTGKGIKSVELILVKDKDSLVNLAKSKDAGSAMLENADAAVVVIGDNDATDTAIEDCSVAMSFMMLEATAQGVGNCWVQSRLRTVNGGQSDDYVRAALGIPANYEVLAILSLGMPKEPNKAYTSADANFGKVHKEKF